MNEILKHFIEVNKNYNSFMEVLEKKKRKFSGIELFPSEIHTLVYIYEHRNENFTEIAKGLNITKGALTKTITKLSNKKLVKKYYREDNQKNIYFRLTKIGEKCFRAHQVFHDNNKIEWSEDIIDYFNNNQKVIINFFMYVNEVISRLNEEIKKYD